MGVVDPAVLTTVILAAEKAEPSKTPFYVTGAVLAAWAVLVAVIGITRPDFPGSPARSRLVMGLSVLLVLGAVTTAITTAHTPAKGEEHGKAEGKPPAGTPAPGGGAPAAGGAIALAADPSGQLAYDKKQLQAKAGKVTVEFENKSPVSHDVTIEQNGAKVAASKVITSSTTTFDATLKAGSYTFYCSVDGHRQLGMQGTLAVS